MSQHIKSASRFFVAIQQKIPDWAAAQSGRVILSRLLL